MAEVKKTETKKWYSQPPAKHRCLCSHPFQDQRYGQGVRLHTMFKNGKRCTVCGSEKL